MKRIISALAAGILLLGGLTACGEIAPPNQVGIWYAQGQVDGNKFDHCVKPSEVDKWIANNSVYWLNNDVRTWNQAPGSTDTTESLVVTAKPEAGQQSGLEVLVWTQTNFKLRTWCGADEKDPNSPLVQWWQNLGDRYDADTADGWRDMLLNTVVPALEKAKNVLREYTADELVLGTVWAEAESKFANTFTTELTRLSGGTYFCGPDYERAPQPGTDTERLCSPVQVSIKDADYRDTGIQAARNDKQKAVESAAARVAEAEGQVAAANAQQALYANPQWMQLQMENIRLQQIQACASAPSCRLIIGVDGQVLINDAGQ